MTAPPLTDIPLVLLENTIKKLEWKSYLRLRQTCKFLEELIRTSGQIKQIRMDKRLYWEQPEDVELENLSRISQERTFRFDGVTPVDPGCLYGLRPAVLIPRLQYEGDVEIFINGLKEYRITAGCLSILNQNPSRIPLEITKEECKQLVDAAGPEKVILSSENSDSFEALFDTQRIKTVEIQVEPEDVCFAVEGLLPRFEKVEISIPNTNRMRRYRTDDFLGMFISILQFLRSTRLPNLRNFQLHIANSKGDQLPSIDQLKEQFRVFHYTILPSDRPSSLYLSIPTHHGTCEFVLEFYAASIYYKSIQLDEPRIP